jgi:hypothetical protein
MDNFTTENSGGLGAASPPTHPISYGWTEAKKLVGNSLDDVVGV